MNFISSPPLFSGIHRGWVSKQGAIDTVKGDKAEIPKAKREEERFSSKWGTYSNPFGITNLGSFSNEAPFEIVWDNYEGDNYTRAKAAGQLVYDSETGD